MKKNENLLSVTEVKKILKEESKETLIELLMDSYKAIPTMKEYLTIKYGSQDNIEQLFESYKSKINEVFFPRNMRGQLKLGDAKKAVTDFKKVCSEEKFVLDLMLYYVEMAIEFTNTYGSINDSFYNGVASMYYSVANSINKHEKPEIYSSLKKRLKAVVDNTSGIGWGLHEELGGIYFEIKWIDFEDIDADDTEIKEIKEFILGRLEKRKDLPDFQQEMNINNVVKKIIEADEVFISKMDAQFKDHSNDDEYDFISDKTGYSIELIQLILWQKRCYEMDKDYWTYDNGNCSKCGGSELYVKEVANEDFADKIICKTCGTEYIIQ